MNIKRSALLLIVISLYTFIIMPAVPVLAQEVQLPNDSDSISPVVRHEPQATTAPSGANLFIEATVNDNVAVKEVTLYYRVEGNKEYLNIKMIPSEGNIYNAMLPSDEVLEPGIEYYIQASDEAGNINQRGIPLAPLSVSVAPVLLPIEPVKAPIKPLERPVEKPDKKETPRVEIEPAKRPELKTEAKPKAWYKSWVVWAVAGGVVVAAAALGGGGGGGGNDSADNSSAKTSGSTTFTW